MVSVKVSIMVRVRVRVSVSILVGKKAWVWGRQPPKWVVCANSIHILFCNCGVVAM